MSDAVPDWQRCDPVAIDPVQYKAWCDDKLAALAAQPIAARGVDGPPTRLPHGDAIQASFGHHDVGGVEAHLGGAAAEATSQLGARAYATGNRVAFADPPDLHTAAHEAAHVVQQRSGLQLAGGFGEDGDVYERHADEVADAVVRGDSAEALLDVHASQASPSSDVVQRKGASERELAESASSMKAISPRIAALNTAVVALERAETDAKNLLRQVTAGALSHDRAYGKLVPIMHAMLAPLAHYDNAQRAPSLEEDRAAQQDALERWRPRVLDALDNVTRVAMLLEERERAAGGALTRGAREASGLVAPELAHDQIAVEAGVGAFASVAASLGWSPPVTRAEADARRYAHEACPTGAALDRPEHCNLPDVEREEQRREVVELIAISFENFVTACEPFEAQLETMVATTAAGRELILGIVTDAVKTGISAATAGAGGRVLDFALGVSYTLGKTQLKRPGAQDAIPEADSLVMMTSLKSALKANLILIREQIRILDDTALGEIHGHLEAMTIEHFTIRLLRFVAAYRDQIEPIGHIAPAYRDQTHGAKYRGVWAVAGDRRRLALVVDRPYTLPLRPREVRHEYRFQRWIDAQFDAVVGGDAVDVPAETIDGMPLAWAAGIGR